MVESGTTDKRDLPGNSLFQKRRIFGIIIDMTNKKRLSLSFKVYKTKDEAIAAGLKQFEKTQVAKLFAQEADFAIGEMALRVERMRARKLPRTFNSIDCCVKDLLISRTAPFVYFKGGTNRSGCWSFWFRG